MYSNYNIFAGYEVEPLFWGLGLEGDFSEVLYIDRDLCSFIFGHFDGRDANLWFCDGEIFPVQAKKGHTFQLGKEEGEFTFPPPPCNHLPNPGYASCLPGMDTYTYNPFAIPNRRKKIKDKMLSFKIDTALFNKIDEVSATMTVNRSVYLRDLIERALGKYKTSKLQKFARLNPINEAALLEMSRIGNNLNQIARFANFLSKIILEQNTERSIKEIITDEKFMLILVNMLNELWCIDSDLVSLRSKVLELKNGGHCDK